MLSQTLQPLSHALPLILYHHHLYFSNMLPFIDSMKETFRSLVVHNVRLTIHHCPLPCSLHRFDYHPSSIMMISSGIIQDSEDDPSCTPMASSSKQNTSELGVKESEEESNASSLNAKTLKPYMHSALSPQCSCSSSLKEALQATDQN